MSSRAAERVQFDVASVALRLSVPIAALAIGTALAGIYGRTTYVHETANWAGQAVGQDYTNLIAYVVLVALAVAAGRGSLRAQLAWTGLVAYSVYTFAIYAFALHFGKLFLVYVAVFGLSVYALVGGLAAVHPAEVKAHIAPQAPVRITAVFLIVVAGLFYLLWLSEVVPAMMSGVVPKAIRDAGVLVNPVHVLDMALLLPAAILTGVLLLRRSALGFVLAPTILGCFIFIGVGIVAAMIVLHARGEAASLGVALGVSALTLVEAGLLVRFLGSVDV